MKTLYLDIFSGISGDMFLGALIDLGVDFHQLEHELQKLGLDDYHLHARHQHKNQIAGTQFEVHLAAEHGHESDTEHHHVHTGGENHDHAHAHNLDHDQEHEHEHAEEENHEPEQEQEHGHSHAHHHGRAFKEIKQLIEASPLSAWVKQKSVAIFQRIAVAEGRIHGCAPEEVHFHEVGAIDSIIDIVGACLALEMLGRPRVLAGPVVDGAGWVNCAHGRFPLPAPATLAILGAQKIPLSQCDEPHEMVTPTGAALLAEFAEDFGPLQGVVAEKIGYGIGARDHLTRPNVLRAILSDKAGAAHDWEIDTIAVLETNLDNINAEILGHFVEQAFQQGALDVFHTAIQMKKNRPGVLLTVLCTLAQADHFAELMLRETSALGIRRCLTERRKLQRVFRQVDTPYGAVTVKLGKLDGQVMHTAPEYESCKQLAAQTGKPLREIYEAALRSLNYDQL